jgi:hypothetical protein
MERHVSSHHAVRQASKNAMASPRLSEEGTVRYLSHVAMIMRVVDYLEGLVLWATTPSQS